MPPQEASQRRRRVGVCGSSVSPEQIKNFQAPVFPKSSKDKKFILNTIEGLDVLFGHIGDDARNKVVDAFEARSVARGTNLISQGDNGDYFYIVDSGNFTVSVQRKGESEPQVVLEVPRGGSFGELALMYNAPRAATCTASEDSEVWAMDRDTFRMMLVTSENTKKKRWEGFLSEVEIFGVMNDYERGQISDILKVEHVLPGRCIVRQGDSGDRFYILEEGRARATILDDQTDNEVTVCTYKKGDYFGELALVNDSGVRAASVYAVTKCALLWIDKLTFDRVFGPIVAKLKKNAAAYPSLQDVLAEKAK